MEDFEYWVSGVGAIEPPSFLRGDGPWLEVHFRKLLGLYHVTWVRVDWVYIGIKKLL